MEIQTNTLSPENKFLVVEDDPSIRAMLRRLFTFMQHTNVTFCGDGREALKEYKSEEIDLILLDLGIPGINGLEVIKEVRANNCEQKIIVCSGYDQLIRQLPNDIHSVVKKPFNLIEMIDAINGTLGKEAITGG